MSVTHYILLTILLFEIKHQLIDFDWQMRCPYEWQNKGTYGHPGGLQHATKHAVGSLLVLSVVGVSASTAAALAVFDGIIHYHVDWAKMNICRINNYTPSTEKFWMWLGYDQLAHRITYLMIVALM